MEAAAAPPLGAPLPMQGIRSAALPTARRSTLRATQQDRPRRCRRPDRGRTLRPDRPGAGEVAAATGMRALHRLREQLKAQRTATINLVRGLLRGSAGRTGRRANCCRACRAGGQRERRADGAARHAGRTDGTDRIALRDMAAIERPLAEAEAGCRRPTLPNAPRRGAAHRHGAALAHDPEPVPQRPPRRLARAVPREHSSGQQQQRLGKSPSAATATCAPAHPRRARGPAGGKPATTHRPATRWSSGLGARPAATAGPQQGGGRAGEQQLARRLWALDHPAPPSIRTTSTGGRPRPDGIATRSHGTLPECARSRS